MCARVCVIDDCTRVRGGVVPTRLFACVCRFIAGEGKATSGKLRGLSV